MYKTSTHTIKAPWQLPGISGMSCKHLKEANINIKYFQCCKVASATGTRIFLIQHKTQMRTERRLLNQAQTQIKRRSKQQFCLQFEYYWGSTHFISFAVTFYTSTHRCGSVTFSKCCFSPLLSGVASCMHAKCHPTLLPPDPSLFPNNLHSLLFTTVNGWNSSATDKMRFCSMT